MLINYLKSHQLCLHPRNNCQKYTLKKKKYFFSCKKNSRLELEILFNNYLDLNEKIVFLSADTLINN